MSACRTRAFEQTSLVCASCKQEGGTCFILTEEDITNLPNRLPIAKAYGWQDAVTIIVEIIQEACKNGFLVVCYQPHWNPPYEALVDRLETGEADVRLAFSGFADSSLPQCSLSAMNYFDDRVLNFANEAAELWRTIFLRLSNQAVPPILANKKPYCLQVDLVKTYACGIRIYQLGGGQREYQGLVEVHLERSLYNPGKDIQIPFKCIDPQISRHREERLMQNIHANVTMQAWTDEVDAKPTRAVAEGDRITLRFEIHSPNAQESISVEKCHLTNSVVQFPSGNNPHDVQIYSAELQTEPHLGDDKAMVRSAIGLADRPGHHHVLPISPPDVNIVQQLPASRSGMHPSGLFPHRQAKEGVCQQRAIFSKGSQEEEEEEEVSVVAVGNSMGTQHPSPGSMICADASIEVTKDNKHI
nr:unnamed protein product [Spirometra erinaceieuropaei]